MKKLLILLQLSFLLHQASAALPFFDPFANATASGGGAYPPGTPLAGQSVSGNTWNSLGGNFPGIEPMIVAGNLSYSNMPSGSGNSVSFAPSSTMSARLNFNATVTTGGRAYYSFLLKITDISAVPTTAANNYFVCFSDGSAGQVQQLARAGTRLLTKKSGSGYVLGVGRNSTTSDFVYDTTVYNVNDVLFVVGSYELVGGTTNVNLWINPSSSSFGSTNAPTPTVSAINFTSTTGNLNTAGVQGFVVLCQNTTAPSGILDELRIGTNWSSVTGGDPAILTSPVSQTIPPGNSAIFNITARGTATLTYQWSRDGNPLTDGGNISGATTATLTVNNISAGDVGAYSVLISNGLGNSVQSSSASLNLLTDPIITVQPQSHTNNFGTTSTFQVTAGGAAPFGYQWHKEGVGDLNDGGNISGSRSNILTLTGVSFPDGGNYSVTVSNAFGAVTSTAAQLTVLDPYISVQPISVTNAAGSNAVFHVQAMGTGPFTYQWFKNGNFLFDNGNLSGTSSDTLTISNISATDQATYTATAVNVYGTATSSTATLTVLSPVSILIPPSPRTVASGTRAVFVVGAAGSAPFSYQWQRAGTNIPNANSATYVLTNVQASVADNYRVIISNSFSAVTSSVVALTISNNLTLARSNLMVIRVGDGAQSLILNGNSMFIDQFKTTGTYVNTVTVPESGSTSMITIGLNNVDGGNSGSISGSGLTRSKDERFIVLAGYNTNIGYASNLKDSTSAAVPRGIATIDSNGQYTLRVADTNFAGFSQQYWRCGVTDGTNNFWGGAGAAGTYYFGFGAPAALIQTNFINLRFMGLFNGDIYCVSAVNGNNGVLKLDGMPTVASTPTILFPGTTGSSDLEVNAAGNLIYVADDRVASNGGGVQRYEFDGSNWTLAYTMTNGLPRGARYLTADFSGANPVIYAISKELENDNNRIVMIGDTGSGSVGTTLASAGVNQTFRSVRFGPIENTVVVPPTLGFSSNGSDIILSWSGAFILQSSTNVTGTYTDIGTANSPYTNSFGSSVQRFFRLRQ
jgi:Immunoglobulin I-set domain/Immunoglobulin domain